MSKEQLAAAAKRKSIAVAKDGAKAVAKEAEGVAKNIGSQVEK